MANSKGLIFHPDLEQFLTDRQAAYYTTLSGGNNSGKSVLLKNMKIQLGRRAYMAGPQRFYHIYELATQRWNLSDYDNWDRDFRTNFDQEAANTETNFIDLGRVLGALKDTKRHELFELCGSLIGSKFDLKKREEDNELSLRYVDMDGQNLSVGSTGTRLLMTLLGLCMDEQFDVMLIDEPELGLSPRIQGELARFFADKERRDQYFPHLKGIFVATHSHIFLDRLNIGNNFTVTKTGKDVEIQQVQSMTQLHDLQFNMLGNSLEALFLPSAFIICEGKTDKPFIERLIQLRHPGRRVLVLESQGDVKRMFRMLSQSLGDIYKSPFRSRTFVVLDSVHTQGARQDLIGMGAVPENIIVWENNGIEYVYPPEVVAEVFSCGTSDLPSLIITNDEIGLNSIKRRKTALCAEVIGAMTGETEQSDELEQKLLAPLAAALGD